MTKVSKQDLYSMFDTEVDLSTEDKMKEIENQQNEQKKKETKVNPKDLKDEDLYEEIDDELEEDDDDLDDDLDDEEEEDDDDLDDDLDDEEEEDDSEDDEEEEDDELDDDLDDEEDEEDESEGSEEDEEEDEDELGDEDDLEDDEEDEVEEPVKEEPKKQPKKEVKKDEPKKEEPKKENKPAPKKKPAAKKTSLVAEAKATIPVKSLQRKASHIELPDPSEELKEKMNEAYRDEDFATLAELSAQMAEVQKGGVKGSDKEKKIEIYLQQVADSRGLTLSNLKFKQRKVKGEDGAEDTKEDVVSFTLEVPLTVAE